MLREALADPSDPETSLLRAVEHTDRKAVRRTLASLDGVVPLQQRSSWIDTVLGERFFSPEVLSLFPGKLARAQAELAIGRSMRELVPLPRGIDGAVAEMSGGTRLALARLRVLGGGFDDALALVGASRKYGGTVGMLVSFFEADYARAAAQGRDAFTGKPGRSPRAGLETACWVMATLASRSASMDDLFRWVDPASMPNAGYVCCALAKAVGQHVPEPVSAIAESDWLFAWTRVAIARLVDDEVDPEKLEILHDWLGRAEAGRFSALAVQLRAGLECARSGRGGPLVGAVATSEPPAPWIGVLGRLDAACVAEAQVAHPLPHPRLLWMLDVACGWCLSPRLQRTRRAPMGKAIDWEQAQSLGCALTAADETILDAFFEGHRRRDPAAYGRMLQMLVGHARVIDPKGRPLRVEEGIPRIETRLTNTSIELSFEPALASNAMPTVVPSEDGIVRIYAWSPSRERVFNAISGEGGSVPLEAEAQVRGTLARLLAAGVVEVCGGLAPTVVEVEADSRPVVSLEWDGSNLDVLVMVAPVGMEGRLASPGEGAESFCTEVQRGADSGALWRCKRDLVAEPRGLEDVWRFCPTLRSHALSLNRSTTRELDSALEILGELDAMGDAVVLAWPQKRRLVRGPGLNAEDLDLVVRSEVDWLSACGDVEVEPGLTLGFAELLEARAGPKYIALAEDRFAGLSDELRRLLDTIERFGASADGEFRVAKSGLLGIAGLERDDGSSWFQLDAGARVRRKELDVIFDREPAIPSGFAAQLRGYQRDGFVWAWRLAEAGLGACLADDMGLGKTVQALAVLVARKDEGAALVVCPTSVVQNWAAEARKFTDLEVVLLSEAVDREAAIQRPGKGVLLVCSYGVMGSQGEALAAHRFGSVVFDEAQFLKNAKTQRWAVARRVTAGFRMALTGTPIENRMLEMWSILSLVVPDLLGTREGFFHRFGAPIEQGDEGALGDLRKLVEPFVLRRTKAKVLAELPPCTEHTVYVSPGAEAQAYYEALREREVARVDATQGPAKMVRLFAALTKLRRAAIDPRLVDSLAPAGSKLAEVAEHAQERVRQGHRVLIFTQFLQSLEMLHDMLEDAGVDCVTLDGSMSASARAAVVDIFQRGDAEVFLLSLRAGGCGMNLTAADEVVHVDPWWNPAVEQQATDRAHRIGQTRPVTVARFITEGSVEERIVELHCKKRKLAEGVIDGLRVADTLDAAALGELLR